MELISNSLTELVHDFQIQIFSELKMMSQSLVVKAFFFFFLRKWMKQASFIQELPLCHFFSLHSFASTFLHFQ